MASAARGARRPGTGTLRGDGGIAVIMAVIAMLVLGIMAFSFTILGGFENRIGLHDAREKQALTTAEAGIHAVRNQIQAPPLYTAFIGNEYSCDTASCTCNNACDVSRLAVVSTGSFVVRVDNDPADPDPAVDTNKRVILTALGTTTDGKGHARVRAWVTTDDPWNHVCASGDGVLCTDPPNNENADVEPPDPNHQNGPRTYPEIPRPNDIRCDPIPGGDPATLTSTQYPVPLALTYASVPGAPRGPCVMYPYYEIALKTPCPMCNPPTSAYDPVSCKSGDQCLGMVRFDPEVVIRSGTSGSGILGVGGGTLGPGTLYVMGKVTARNSVGTILGTMIFHGGGDPGSGGAQTDLHFDGPHTVTTQGPACLPNCAYPLVILGYNPNEPNPPGQTLFLDISNNGVQITGVLYTGGTVDFGPNSITGSMIGQTVNANNAATEFTYSPAYEAFVPPPAFTTPSLTLPSVIAAGTWLQCRRADSLGVACD